MDIAVTFTLSTGEEFVSSTSDFATLEAFQTQLERFVGQPAGRLTWHDTGGRKRMLAAQHIVSVAFVPAVATAEIGRSVVEAIQKYEGRGDPPELQPA